MKATKYPYFRITRYYCRRPSLEHIPIDAQSWFDHLVKLDTPVALVFCPKRGWSVWRIGHEYHSFPNVELLTGTIKDALGYHLFTPVEGQNGN